MSTYTAIIPTETSDLYPTFGVDIVSTLVLDEDGVHTQDMQPVEWIEGGEVMPEDPKDAAFELAKRAGWFIDTSDQRMTESAQWIECPVEKIA